MGSKLKEKKKKVGEMKDPKIFIPSHPFMLNDIN